MDSRFVIGHLKTAGGAARQTVIDALRVCCEYAANQEPGVYKYCLALPRDEHNDDKSVFAIEEYGDQTIQDKHMASQGVKELLRIFDSDPTLFAEPPAIYGLPSMLKPSASFARSSLASLSDPYIIFSNFEYKKGHGVTSEAIKGWKELVSYAEEKEEGTVTYTVLEDAEKGWVRTVEAYESEDYLRGVHVKSIAIEKNQKQNGGLRTGVKEIWKLKKIAGYLYKDASQAKL